MSENDQETPENPAVPEAPAATETETTTVAIAPTPAPAKPKGYAIIETGGKQYRVSVGDRISVERLPDDEGGEITIDRVLLVGGEGATRVGTPVVAGATVTATVDDHFRGEKIIVFKYKPKKRYRRRIGHRQELTHLKITAIAG
jgi:large subunit ribosomal protein L21